MLKVVLDTNVIVSAALYEKIYLPYFFADLGSVMVKVLPWLR